MIRPFHKVWIKKQRLGESSGWQSTNTKLCSHQLTLGFRIAQVGFGRITSYKLTYQG
jgi:hypothetical protein